jgi:ABC-type proline/glycine betaine transport system permease subunit
VRSNNHAIRSALVVLVAVALIGAMIGGALFGPGGM